MRLFTESKQEMEGRRQFWQYVQEQAESNARSVRNMDELEDALSKVKVLQRIRAGGRVVSFSGASWLGNSGALWLGQGIVESGSHCRVLDLTGCSIGDEGFATTCGTCTQHT